MVGQAQLAAAEALDMTGLGAQEADHIIRDRVVVADIALQPQEACIAAETRHLRVEADEPAARRILLIVQRVVDEAQTDG
jgi:hypothetical protein